jgi:O-antigen ligase
LFALLIFCFCYFIYQEELIWLTIVGWGLLCLSIVAFVVEKISSGLQLLIVSAPISLDITFSTGGQISFPTELLTLFVLLLVIVKWLIGLKLNDKILKHPLAIILIVDLVWTVISATQSDLGTIAFKRVLLKGVYLIVYFVFFGNFLNTLKLQKGIFSLYGLGFLIPIVYTLISHAEYNFEQPYSPAVSEPFYADHTIYGACLAFIIPFFALQLLEKKNVLNISRPILIGLVLLLLMAVTFSYSRATWLSLFGAGGLFILIKFRIRFGIVVSLLLIGGGFASLNFYQLYASAESSSTKYDDDVVVHLSSVTNLKSDASNLERINRWVCAIRMARDKPLFGWGPGTYQFEYDKYQTPEFMTRISTHKGDKGNAHSEYLMTLSETGIVGFLLFVTMVLMSIRLGLKVIYASQNKEEKMLATAAILGLSTFFIHGLFNTFSDMDKMAILFLGSLSILVNIDLQQSGHNSQEVECL